MSESPWSEEGAAAPKNKKKSIPTWAWWVGGGCLGVLLAHPGVDDVAQGIRLARLAAAIQLTLPFAVVANRAFGDAQGRGDLAEGQAFVP